MAKQNKKDNIFIDYTKWIFKWIFILILIGGLGFGSYLAYLEYEKSKPDETTLIVVECEVIEDNWLANIKAGPDWKNLTDSQKENLKDKVNSMPVGYKSLMKITKDRDSEHNIPKYAYFVPTSVDNGMYNPLTKKLSPSYKYVSTPPDSYFEIGLKTSFDTYVFVDFKYGNIDKNQKSFWTWDRKTLTRKHYRESYGKTPYYIRECKKISESLFDKAYENFVKSVEEDFQI
ncbi:hypothetical protein N9A22_00920 [Methylophilaceae bacterium]|nr:hypothetical protein [Methylophilaceae bacterium]